MKRVVIVGAGIAGLTAAYRLRDKAVVTVLDDRDRPGGVIETVRENGFTVEGGPDSFLASTKPWAAELCSELGLDARIIRPTGRTVHVLSERKLHPLPEGFFLTVPTKIGPLLKSPLFSLAGKMRMGLDLVLPRGPEVEDESIADFVRRRLGREALDKVADPLMAGIYMASAERLSLRATFPRFADIEREHRSLIKTMRKIPPGGSVSPFLSLRGGIGELVSALTGAMKDVTFRRRARVRSIDAGWKVRTDDDTLDADAVILAVPARAVAEMTRASVPALADAASKFEAVGSTTVSLGFRDVKLPEGTGFVIARGEGRKILACTWSSQKFEDRAPAGHVLVRCFLSERPDDPVAIARNELREILGITAEPVLARAFSWPGANPVYEVGHHKRVRDLEATLPPGLHVTGAAFRGIGLPDSIHDATLVAERVSGRA